MATALTFAGIDLLGSSYHTTQLPAGTPSRMRRVDPRWNSPTNQTGILGRSQLVHVTLEFEIVCRGGTSYNTALAAFTAIKTALDNTRTYWATQGASGTNATVSRTVGDQSSATVYTIFDGDWIDLQPNLTEAGAIWGRLSLLAFEGSVTAGAVHAAVAARTSTVPAVQMQVGGNALKFDQPNNSMHLAAVLF
jgi:hypothetical protein